MDKKELKREYVRNFHLFGLSDGSVEFADEFVKAGNALRELEETREL